MIFLTTSKNSEGAEITEFLTDGIVEMWLEFDFRGQSFPSTINSADYHVFVEAKMSREILLKIVSFSQLLERRFHRDEYRVFQKLCEKNLSQSSLRTLWQII